MSCQILPIRCANHIPSRISDSFHSAFVLLTWLETSWRANFSTYFWRGLHSIIRYSVKEEVSLRCDGGVPTLLLCRSDVCVRSRVEKKIRKERTKRTVTQIMYLASWETDDRLFMSARIPRIRTCLGRSLFSQRMCVDHVRTRWICVCVPRFARTIHENVQDIRYFLYA